MESIVLIDSHSLIHRAYHALPKTIATADGKPTNAVYGFTRMVLRVLKDLEPEYVAACFDAPGPTFRSEEFKEYKAHRPTPDRELTRQFSYVDEVADALSLQRLRVGGYEADDLIATLVSRLTSKGREIIIVTGDNDLMQLVTDRVAVYYPVKGISKSKMYHRGEVIEKFALPPEQIVDYKALRGDPSDNIPGVPGIGDKTAKELLSQYQTVENIKEHLGKITGRMGDLLRSHWEQVELSKKLASLENDVPLDVSEEDLKVGIDLEKALPVLKKYQFKSLITELQKEKEDTNQLPLI